MNFNRFDDPVGGHVQQYSSIDDFNGNMSLFTGSLVILHINIRSFNKNSDCFCLFSGKLAVKPDVLVFTETWFSCDTVSDLDDYDAHHVYRNDRRGGGVSIYIRRRYTSKAIVDWSYIGEYCEVNSVSIEVGSVHVVIHGIYRPPDRDMRGFTDDLSSMLSDVRRDDHVFIVGDLNVDIANPAAAEIDIISLFHTSSFLPLITVPTYVTRVSSSCLDHIWYNQLDEVRSGVFQVDISDHYPVFACARIICEASDSVTKKFRDHSELSLTNFRAGVAVLAEEFMAIISDYDHDIDFLLESFSSQIYSVYNRSCPIRTKQLSVRRFMKPWMTDELVDCVHHKHVLFRRYRAGAVSLSRYTTYRNQVTNIIRRRKSKYFADKFYSNMNNPVETWKLVNSMIKKPKKKIPIELYSNNLKIVEQTEVANCLNNYFSTVARELDAKIPRTDSCPLSFMGDRRGTSLFISPVTELDVRTVVCALKCKNFDLNSVPTFIYKHCVDLMGPVLSELFNISVRSGRFPSALKLARIVPVHKSGDNNSANNYRPISNLSDLAKIFEKLMYRQLITFIKSQRILSNNQFGFRENSSTSDAVSEFIDNVYNKLDKKLSLITVFLDFSKAFDTVNHDILIAKLDHLGIRGQALEWFRSYLSDREQYVSVEGSCSTRALVRTGVPQGSILGPLLFLLYINDMSKCTRNLQFVHFADDTTVFNSGSNIADVVNEMNAELTRIADWLKANRLSLNVGKTTYMIISDGEMLDVPAVRIGDRNIIRVTESKFLGITIDEKLSFKHHVSGLSKSLSRSIGVINRVSDLVPPRIKKLLYFSLIYPRVSYGIIVWGQSSAGNVNLIDRILYRAHKCVSYPRATQFNTSRFLNFDSIYKYFTAVKLYKVLKQDQHLYFSRVFHDLLPIHNYGTRFSTGDNINVPHFTKAKCQRGFVFQSVAIWNNLSDELKSLSPNLFKKELKKELLSRQTYRL